MQQRQHLNTVDELQTLLKQRKLLQQFAISRLGVFAHLLETNRQTILIY